MASEITQTTFLLIQSGTITMATTDFTAVTGGYLGTKTVDISSLAQLSSAVNPTPGKGTYIYPAASSRAPHADIIHTYNQSGGNIILTIYDTLPYTVYDTTTTYTTPPISINSYCRMINSFDSVNNSGTFSLKVYYFTTTASTGETFKYKVWSPLF